MKEEMTYIDKVPEDEELERKLKEIDKKVKCEICKEKEYVEIWINEIVGYKSLKLCEECGKCLGEQLSENIPILPPLIVWGKIKG